MLNDRIEALRENTRSGYYRRFRTGKPDFEAIRRECRKYSPCGAAAHYFHRVVQAETPVIIPGERLQFTRTVGVSMPKLFEGRELENLSPDYGMLLQQGLAGRLNVIEAALADTDISAEEKDYMQASRQSLLDITDCAGRYAAAAEEMGENELAALFRKVPFHPAETLQEALQSIYFVSALLHLSTAYHIGFGRTDQYLREYYRRDLAEGRETAESARELLTEFFIILSRDYDLYEGIQLGDNGQSMVLGGVTADGFPAENELTILLMDIAADISMIEPKINLRVSSETSEEVLRSAARLSGCGLGFPQYSNDEVIIPALIKFGYPPEKARDYCVAACWEFVLPGGRDVPNLFGLNLAFAADCAIRKLLRAGEAFEAIKARLKEEIQTVFSRLTSEEKTLVFLPNPAFSAFCTDVLENRRDLNISGGNHRNFGCHGCAASTAADSLAAVKHFVYDEKSIAPAEMLEALEKNFEGYEDLRIHLRSSGEQVGCGSELADEMLKLVFDTFAEVLEGAGPNRFGGKYRPGSGSALLYARMTQEDCYQRLYATADGRRDGEYFGSNLSPAPGVKAAGILSVLDSFSNIDYDRICNGGPITLELDPVYFKSENAVEKMISFLRAFVRSGNQQLQLNTLDADLLRRAQKHPEEYRDLIVRVWGWSGYFVELDKVYQDQIIARQAFRG